jgi:CRP-like cAMP-binding protein
MPQSASDAILRHSGAAAVGDEPAVVVPRRTRRRDVESLAGVPLFSDLSRRHLSRLAKESDEVVANAGERIVEEGRPGEALFVVLAGRAVVKRGRTTVGTLVPGDFFGELSAIDSGPRTATVIADTPVRLLRLFRHTLASLLRDEPKLTLKLLDGMCRRVREMERRSRGTA